jgi:carboxybiotin decarboxylase
MEYLTNYFFEFIESTGFANFEWTHLLMILVGGILVILGVVKKYEPLLLIPIGLGVILANIAPGLIAPPETGHLGLAGDPAAGDEGPHAGGLFWYFYKGIEWEIFPPLIFLGVGALTDFGPLLSNPKTFLLGAAAQFGIFGTFFCAILLGFDGKEAGSIAIIGGADGPTAIFTASKLVGKEMLAAIAISAYSYMALVPIIQPPIMRLLTTKKERQIKMENPKEVSPWVKILFPIIVMILAILIVPASAPLIAMLMIGNLFREVKVVGRLLKAAQNEIIDIVTIFLGVCVGITMNAERFMKPETLLILVLGAAAFCVATASGLIFAKIMNLFVKRKINPLIGAAGVSAVPMAARVVHNEGRRYDPNNYLLFHAMGPNVAGVLGSAIAAGVIIKILG